MSRVLPSNPSVTLDYGSTPDTGWGTNGTVTTTNNSTITITSAQDGDTVSGPTSGINVIIDSNTTINGHGWQIGNTDNPTTVTVNGTLSLTNADVIASGSKVLVSNGGTLILGGYATTTPGLIQFDGTGGTIEVAAGTTPSIIEYITNISKGDTIVLDGITADNYMFAQGVYTLTENGQPISGTASFQLPTANEGTTFTVKTIGGKTYLTADTVLVCFLAGSMIRTPNGDVAVEHIGVGDDIITFDWKSGQNISQPVTWAGKARATVRPGLRDDEAGYPVRVLKNAIAEGVPYKDMLITAEHCLFFENRFVPVRMLVNGASIFYDKSILSYDYYHIETERHSVITADGMLTESYLDTGNRASFQQNGPVVMLRGVARSWTNDAAALLDVDQASVKRLYHHLKAVAQIKGLQADKNAPVLTTENNLHLLTNTGARIRPIRQDGTFYRFMLPPNTHTVRILSNASRPVDVVGPFANDRRYMGVAVAGIHFTGAKTPSTSITTHLEDVRPTGWYAREPQADWAWTDGNAVLPLHDETQGEMGLLTLEIRAAGPYVITPAKRMSA